MLAWGLIFLGTGAALRQVRLLSEALQPVPEDEKGGPLPSLAIVVTACNEAERIESTVRTLIEQSYPDLRIIVVDDRSTDETGTILDRLACEPEARSRLDVVHNSSLPDGWLGKCHACHLGAQRARGEWLLFIDGDVVLSRTDLLARLVRLAERERIDHLSVIPDMEPMTRLQTALIGVFGQIFLLAMRAFEMERDLPRGGASVGAFNLLRREAYEAIGGHEPLRMDPADDVKLGLLLKESGARQRLFNGRGLIRCPWHSGTLQVIRGLEKNGFAGCRYSIGILVVFTLLAIWFSWGPFVSGVLASFLLAGMSGPASVTMASAAGSHLHADGLARAVLIAAWVPFAFQMILLVAGWAVSRRRLGARFSNVLLYPFAALLLVIAFWNSAIRTLARGGVEWRGTFYPLDALRRGLVRPGRGRRLRALQ